MGEAQEFEYYATDTSGEAQSGTVSAADREAAMEELNSRELRVLSLAARSGRRSGLWMHGNINGDDFVRFNAHLSSMTKSGRPLPEGLQAITSEMKEGRFRAAIEDVRAEIDGGRSLSEALGRHQGIFSDLYVNLVKGGEVSGNLSGVLLMVSRQSNSLLQVRRKIIGALLYPTIIGVVGLAVYAFLSLVVAPHLVAIYRDIFGEGDAAINLLGASRVPGLTKLTLLFTSPIVMGPICLIGLAGIVLIWTCGRWSVPGREVLEWVARLIPVVREMLECYDLSRVSGSLSMLTEGRVPVPEALGLVATSPASRGLTDALRLASAEVAEGTPLAEALRGTGYFPETFSWMVSLGEQTGDLPEALADLAEMYEGKAARAAAFLDIVLAPLVVLLMGIIVGFFVAGIFLPFMQLMRFFGSSW